MSSREQTAEYIARGIIKIEEVIDQLDALLRETDDERHEVSCDRDITDAQREKLISRLLLRRDALVYATLQARRELREQYGRD